MDAIAQHAKDRPDAKALVQGDRIRTWRELDRRANQTARALQRLGVGPGDCVAVALRNSIEFIELIGGAGRLGATVMPVSYRNKRDEVEYLIDDAKAAVIIAEPDNAEVFEGLPETIFRGDAYDQLIAVEDEAPLPDQEGTGMAGLRYYTSGTTGRPKTIVRKESGRDPAELAKAFTAVTEARLGMVMGPGEVHLLAAVLYHTAPGAYAASAIGRGHTVVIMERFDPAEALRLIDEERVTWTQMAPIHFVRIVGLPEETKRRYDLSSLKRVLHAGAPCPVDVKWKILDLFPKGTVYEYYAATEGYATECPEDVWRAHPGTVGKPVAGIEIHILDDDGNEVGPDLVGQVYINNGSSFEYLGAPEKTAETWRGDMFSVGDMGYVDDDGYLFLTDRKTHMIISGGANIYPAEVESVLFAHPAVADVAVIGVPDDEFGEQVKAVVERRHEVTEAELISFCRDRLSHYKCPKSVDFVAELPRDPNGKIKKKQLRDPYWEGHTAKI
ncbi:MAG TPA: AMP-binding protein [Acidimicrobiales bacterium]|jgi:long-chain acyl-CoA synthetase